MYGCFFYFFNILPEKQYTFSQNQESAHYRKMIDIKVHAAGVKVHVAGRYWLVLEEPVFEQKYEEIRISPAFEAYGALTDA